MFKELRGLLLSLAFASGVSQAAFIDGSVDITGAFVPVDGGGSQVALGVATGIDFTTPGVVVASSGDLSSLTFLTTATMTDFQFSPVLSPNPVTLWSAGGFSFDMYGVTVNSQSNTNLSLSGQGTVSGGGLDDTPGIWEFTANTASGSTTFSWSSSTVAAIPLPAAVWLFGTGLAGLLAVARRRS